MVVRIWNWLFRMQNVWKNPFGRKNNNLHSQSLQAFLKKNHVAFCAFSSNCFLVLFFNSHLCNWSHNFFVGSNLTWKPRYIYIYFFLLIMSHFLNFDFVTCPQFSKKVLMFFKSSKNVLTTCLAIAWINNTPSYSIFKS
jgi:hypothetical protein